MKEKFVTVQEAIAQEKPAALEFEVDGLTYTRNFQPKERLILLGAGHIAQPLSRYAADLGFSVVVVDERPSFANKSRFPDAEGILCDEFAHAIGELNIRQSDYICIITRGHRYDADCLRAILPGTQPRYLGMIGSKRRTIELLNMLDGEGFERSLLDTIHTPIGLDINAITTKEIAISIIAEIIKVRRKDTSRRSKSTILTAEDIDQQLLDFITVDPEPKAVLIVYETSGSTPVKSGAMMAIDKNYRIAGSVGGGCSESAVMRDAYDLIGTGTTKCVDVDMSNDVAAEEGMVCGGHMSVFMSDLN
jgi:xanthine dehydrogenase accessory factor